MTNTPASLYVVATPIGNLGDMVPRAVEALQTVDLIACEDTRHSAHLFNHFGIKTPSIAYHDHSDSHKVALLIDKLKKGQSIALISDAGTPLISDPGYRLVKEVREAGFAVIPVPGACALIAALSVSGLASDKFIFEGFLPAKQQARLTHLQLLSQEKRTLIFYEAPHRILDSLEDMKTAFGADRYAVVAREITKTFETIHGDCIEALCEWVSSDTNQQRGEIVLLVEGFSKPETQDLDAEQERIMKILLKDLPIKQAAALGAQITGLKKNFLYQWGLEQLPDNQ